MKKILFALLFAALPITALLSQEWISFTRSEASEPETAVGRSDAYQVGFTVSLPGFSMQAIDTISETFRRLSLPGHGAIGAAGAPEIPVVRCRIAVPECGGINYSIQMSGARTFENYLLWPAPEYLKEYGDDSVAYLVEHFIFDDDAYTLNAVTPEIDYKVLEHGYLRDQRFVDLELYPFRYNPATRQLSVAETVAVTLSFTNPTSDVNVNMGIFGKVAVGSMFNYSMEALSASANDKAFDKGVEPGMVTWRRLSDTSHAKNIQADYLIICAGNYFKQGQNPHPEVLRIANHRAQYNGFDVVILNVDNLISDGLGFYYEGNPSGENNDEYKKEQRIRTCIRRIYEGKKARHTFDGRLGYVLLIGDVDAGNNGMPSSFSHQTPIVNNGPVPPSDYDYSCVTRNAAGKYDYAGDLFIGRFCVPNTEQAAQAGVELHNIVEKTIYYETEFHGEDWKNHVLLTTGYNTVSYAHEINQMKSAVAGCLHSQFFSDFHYYYTGDYLFRKQLLDTLHYGAVLLNMLSHGSRTGWWEISKDELKQKLTNDYKTPFCMSSSCSTGYLDGGVCFAEDITTYSPTRGFAAVLAPTRDAMLPIGGGLLNGYNVRLPMSIFNEMAFIAGECVLQTKMRIQSLWGDLSKSDIYNFNLFGDPALNIMAEGFLITRQLTMYSPARISCPVTIAERGSLTLAGSRNPILYFDNNGSITITSAGNIVFADNTSIYGFGENNFIYFPGGDSGDVTRKNLTLSNMKYKVTSINSVLKNYDNLHFINSSFQYNGFGTIKILNCSFEGSEIVFDARFSSPYNRKVIFENTTLTHSPLKCYNYELEANENDFYLRSDIIATNSSVKLDMSILYGSGVYATILPNHNLPFSPFVQITNNDFRNIGTFYIENNNALDPSIIISKSAIRLEHIPEFNISNNTIINTNAEPLRGIDPGGQLHGDISGEGIFLTGSGMGNVNNRIITNNSISKSETGFYCYNSRADMTFNEIFNNIYGVRLFNNSVTTFLGDSDIANGEQIIRDNTSYEIYASSYSFPSIFRYNQIVDEDNGGNSATPRDPLFYYDNDYSKGIDPGTGLQVLKNISNNYWGTTFNSGEDIYAVNANVAFSITPIWYPGSSPGGLTDSDEELYLAGASYFEEGDYESAESAFLELIESYPESSYAIAALHELFALEQFLDDNYETLRDFYRESEIIASDSALFAAADFLATRCDVRLQNWQPPIDWYEARIQEPPSFPDSIFAVIDLGEIFLMIEQQEGDTTGLKAAQAVATTMAHLIPNSEGEYAEHKAELLAQLPKTDKAEEPFAFSKEQKGALLQNTPNPAHGTTIIRYGLSVDGQAAIVLYNLLGEAVKTIALGKRTAGSYQTEVALSELAPGSYLYTLFVDGERTDTKKMIVR